jgi:hypothetical protein
MRHEAAVAEFMASVPPEVIADLQRRWPVLTEHQMRHRLRREIPVGDEHDVEIVARRALVAGRRFVRPPSPVTGGLVSAGVQSAE